MRKATITRHTFSNEGTFGDYVSDSGFKCYTLERLNDGPSPCIPSGKYSCFIEWSKKFEHTNFGYGYGMIYELQGVNGRTEIKIHPANFVEQLLGCIAPGLSVGLIKKQDGTKQMGVLYSRAAVFSLMKDMGGEPFELTIIDKSVL